MALRKLIKLGRFPCSATHAVLKVLPQGYVSSEQLLWKRRLTNRASCILGTELQECAFKSHPPHGRQASADAVAFEILMVLKAALTHAPVYSLIHEASLQWNPSFDPSSECYLRLTEDISSGKVTQLPYILQNKNPKARLPNM